MTFLPPPSRVRVRYAETDKMGVVYYANYLVWFEVSRTDWLRHAGWSYVEMEAEGYTKAPAAPAAGTLNAKLLSGKWTDGKYTYEITAAGDIKIGSKSYLTSDAKYPTIATNLNKDFSDGKLTSGSAPKKSYTAPAEVYTPPATTDAATPGLQDSGSVTDAWWFWPAVGVGTLAVGGGVYFAFLRRT